MNDLKPITYGEWISDLVMVALGAGAVCLLVGLLLGYHVHRRDQFSHETYKPARRDLRTRREHRRALEEFRADIEAYEEGADHG